jgi:mono/diheme cytochrome c family protein
MKKTGILFVFLCASVLILSMTFRVNQDDKWPVPDKYKKMKNPFATSTDSEQNGKMLYATHCKSCHGTKGKGDGTKAKELKTKVPDLTSAAVKGEADGAIYYKTFFGKDDMPGFEKKIGEEEDRWLLVNYVKKLQ